MAVPAHPGRVQVRQPDGSYVTLQLHGDEWMNFHTTADGYSVVKNQLGFYVYAQLSDGRLEATQHVAHDAIHRSPSEQKWLEGVRKYQAPALSERSRQLKAREQNRRAATLRQRRAQYDYNKFRGLVILVEFNDRPFSRSDFKEVFNDMVNKPYYKGYDDTTYGQFTGSVRDYFVDNSMGMFEPQFDIIGPIRVNYSQYVPNQMDSIHLINYDALTIADQIVNFRDYDTDQDGIVDMIYFVYAGIGSHYQGNDERLVWPHTSIVWYDNNYVMFDGVYLGYYACSTELVGSESYNMLDGIGTMCHEFSHVLGLPDFYDTDYEGSGGQSHDPDLWSVMSGGCYLNNSRTPVGYSLYDRYSVGFATPEVITAEGNMRLNPLPLFNKGYRINTEVENEFFLLENRQPSLFRWDKYLPGHGMLVYRVDSTNVAIWEANLVNANPRHNYYEMVRAGNNAGTARSDPFPGSKKVTNLDNFTEPANLRTWGGKKALWGLYDISEIGNVIRFEVREPEDPDAIIQPTITVSHDNATAPEGPFYNLQGQRVSPTTKGLLIHNGHKLVKP